jgi:hypothetical protein
VSYIPTPAAEITNWIVKLETKDGKTTGSLVFGNPRMMDATLEKATVEKDHVRLAFKVSGNEHVYEGRVSAKEKDRIRGTYDDDRRVYIAHLVRTDVEKLEQAEMITRRSLPAPMQQVTELTNKPFALRGRANREKDPEEKKKLLEQATAAAKESEAALPKLYEKVLADHADDVAVFDAGLNLLRGTAKSKVEADKVRQWATILKQAAEKHDPRWHNEIVTQIAEILAPNKEYGSITLEFAQAAEKQLPTDAAANQQSRVLKALLAGQRFAGKGDTGETQARLDKVEAILDKEYYVKVPPLKAEAFAGRKGSSDRAVVMELFTGAQCPPCVAADVAFDALAKAYKPSELILLQYHLHIPGPDPLTNADSEARMDMYRKQFPEQIRGTPSTAFNGKPQAGGGGALRDAERKLTEYRGIIDSALEEPAGAKVKTTATSSGDKINVKVDVSDLREDAANLRLCVALLEENVRYVGSNKLRFHHFVVRALPTGAEGVALPAKGQPFTTSIDLKELRDKLTKYLDDYGENTRPFPNSDRPMVFQNLRVVAFLQDATTKEIVQGAVADVGGQSAKR